MLERQILSYSSVDNKRDKILGLLLTYTLCPLQNDQDSIEAIFEKIKN